MSQIVSKIFLFLPAFYTVANYFTVLKEEQRTSKTGIMFLLVSVLYFALCIYFLVINWWDMGFKKPISVRKKKKKKIKKQN